MTVQKDTISELFVLSIGNGASPEVFAPLCSFAAGSRGLSIDGKYAERTLADCASVIAPQITKRSGVSYDWSIDAEGVCNAGDDKTLVDWAISMAGKNVKLTSSTTGAVIVSGNAVAGSVKVTGPGKGQSVTVQVSLQANGALTTSAAP